MGRLPKPRTHGNKIGVKNGTVGQYFLAVLIKIFRMYSKIGPFCSILKNPQNSILS
jgi:hypothetical protein